MELNEKNVKQAQEEQQRRLEEQRARELEVARNAAFGTAAPGQTLTPEAEQIQNAAREMLTSGTDPGLVAGYVEKKRAETEQARKQQRGGGRG